MSRSRIVVLAVAVSLTAAILGYQAWSRGPRERVSKRINLVDEQNRPVAGIPLRIVYGFERNPRAASAGIRTVTGEDGMAIYRGMGQLGRHWISGSGLLPEAATYVEIGLELELAGHPVLYWIELNRTGTGASRKLAAFVPNSRFVFDEPLVYDEKSQSYSFPGEPGGVHFTDLGIDTRSASFERDDRGGWLIQLELVRRTFVRR